MSRPVAANGREASWREWLVALVIGCGLSLYVWRGFLAGGGLVGECPLRDVAGMLRSFGYLGDALGCADPIRAMKATFLEGYYPDGMCERDERFLKAFCVQRAFREWLYERAHRPDWAQRPLRVPLF